MKRLTDIQTTALTNLAKYADAVGHVDWDKLWVAGLVPANTTLRALERRGLVVLVWTSYNWTSNWNGVEYPTHTRTAITGATLTNKDRDS